MGCVFGVVGNTEDDFSFGEIIEVFKGFFGEGSGNFEGAAEPVDVGGVIRGEFSKIKVKQLDIFKKTFEFGYGY